MTEGINTGELATMNSFRDKVNTGESVNAGNSITEIDFQDWLKVINEYGGSMGETYGVPVSEIVEAIKYGVRKVNIDTDLRMAATGAIRRFLAENGAEFDPRKYNAVAKDAMSGICQARYEAFGSAGHANKIKVLSLETMFQRYQTGELDPRIK